MSNPATEVIVDAAVLPSGRRGVGCLDRKSPNGRHWQHIVPRGRDRSGALMSASCCGRIPQHRRIGSNPARSDGPRLRLQCAVGLLYRQLQACQDSLPAREYGCTRSGSGHKLPTPNSVPVPATHVPGHGGCGRSRTGQSGRWRRGGRSLVFGLLKQPSDKLRGDDLPASRQQFEAVPDIWFTTTLVRGCKSLPCQFGDHLSCSAFGLCRNFLRGVQDVGVDVERGSHGATLMHLMQKSRFDAKGGLR